MKGFCSGSSIEIDLDLERDEISRLEKEILRLRIRRVHENPHNFVSISLQIGDTSNEEFMKLKCLPKDCDFENTKEYEITLSNLGYSYLKERNGVIDRPGYGTKVSIRRKN